MKKKDNEKMLITGIELPRVPVTTRPQIFLVLAALLLCFFFFLGVFVVIYILHRLKREKMKKLLAIETARAAVVTQWTKKVIVEKQSLVNAQNVQEPLLMPVVKIEKQKSTITAEDSNGGSSISEYELPLDSAWELSREYLALGNTLGEGAFGKVVRAQTNTGKPGIPCVVAVKMLKGNLSTFPSLSYNLSIRNFLMLYYCRKKKKEKKTNKTKMLKKVIE